MNANDFDFEKIKNELHKILKEELGWPSYEYNARSWNKEDGSPVTNVDLRISKFFEELCQSKNVKFLSEENLTTLEFPVVILDPVDGTKSLINQGKDWSVSFAYYQSKDISDPRNFSWIYSPYNNTEISNESKFSSNSRDDLLGFVSYNEYKEGLHKDCEGIKLKPVSSIAYKLGLLSIGECDFVISRRPKGVWDIAAGANLCAKSEINTYQNNQKIETLEHLEYKNDLLWCTDRVFQKLKGSGYI